MNIPSWLNDITLEQLPQPYEAIARAIGVPNTLKLASMYQGTGFYFPKLDGVLSDMRNKRIREEFTGSNHKELARKYELTERWIYEIITQNVDENQISFFT